MTDPLNPPIPAATYRLQFNKEFTFVQARDLVPYLHELGISHIYASPYFTAAPGSMHGYDITNHNELNPEVGTRAEYESFVGALRECGMGQIVDFVPNHMGIDRAHNAWWRDVLENGPIALHAPFFDIDWDPLKEELENKVLLPILGDQYGRVLERGELKPRYEAGAFHVDYFSTRLPLTPRSYALILRPAVENLRRLYANDDCLIELESILTAMEHLPVRTDTAPAKIAERAREAQVIKRRLDRLCTTCPQVSEVIAGSLHELSGTVGDARSFDALDALLNSQCYRLSYWRVAAEEINYRRFFDINTLAAISMERPEVFEEAHRLVFELIGAGAITGLRIDHVDGLWNPREYLQQLQANAAARLGGKPSPCAIYLLVEKILAGNERLRADWPVHGTTGYDFTNQVIAVLIDSEAEKAFTRAYEWFTGSDERFADLVYERKQLTMRLSLASEINVLGHMLNRLSERNRWYRDFTLNALTTAVREVIACFPVYRTYLEPGVETAEDDRQVISRAAAVAKRRNPGLEASVFDFLRDVLLMHFPENIDEAAKAEHLHFVMKFQQCTGPIMAKGLEDTAFYIYNRFVALNDVGGEPQHFGATVETFHAQNTARLEHLPHAMLATSTHDTKRSEDVRARLAALSELPAQWRQGLQRWRTLNRKHRSTIEGETAPDANEEYLLYQTLLGTWPLNGPDDAYIARIQNYMTKAVKEAKVNSSWIQPNDAWDTAVRDFVAKSLDPNGTNRFLKSFAPIAAQVAELGAINALSQTVLKLTVPGVPDIYQGNELWDYSLVDPDNRRPVDYAGRRAALEAIDSASPAELFANWRDGRIKLFLIRALLHLRRDNPNLFARGSYSPLERRGAFARNCIAFARELDGQALVVLAPRLSSRIGFPPIGDAWRDTAIPLSPGAPFKDVFTGSEFSAETRVAELFSTLPVAVLIR
jgi:(1->4)-alpha-D-glucan 1-alpha-D-glucosylmutase